jgi:hypothetical protein
MAEPVRALQALPSVTLKVRFQEGKLWKARYPSLIRYDSLGPELQFEPAFQVFSDDHYQQVEVLFSIDENENAGFSVAGGEVSWQSLVPNNPAPLVEVGLVDEENPKVCRVLWTRSGVPLVALRIACEPLFGQPASDQDAVALTRVEGGVYLAIIDPGEVLHRFPEPVLPSGSPPEPGRVRVVGIDARSRPVYDLFTATDLPEELAPELAFRAAHGESPVLPILLDLHDHDIRYKVVENDQVAMEYVFPTERPAGLDGTPASEENRLCTLRWKVPPFTVTDSVGGSEDGMRRSLGSGGRVASMNALLDPGRLSDPHLREATAQVRIDPTVIEPPACDAGGVCTRPRDQMCDGLTTGPAAGIRHHLAAARTRGAGTRRGRRTRGRGRGGR